MDIPEWMKGQSIDGLNSKLRFTQALLTSEGKGVIIGDAVFLEHILGELLCTFAKTPGGPPLFSKSNIEKMDFNRKIQTLTGLTLDGGSNVLRDQIVATINAVRNLRNEAAHQASLTTARIDELYAVPEYLRLLENYPGSWNTVVAEVQDWLQRLKTSTMFKGDESSQGSSQAG